MTLSYKLEVSYIRNTYAETNKRGKRLTDGGSPAMTVTVRDNLIAHRGIWLQLVQSIKS